MYVLLCTCYYIYLNREFLMIKSYIQVIKQLYRGSVSQSGHIFIIHNSIVYQLHLLVNNLIYIAIMLSGRVAIVTGAAQGIGLATTHLLLRSGAKVCVPYLIMSVI